jgi:GntR family transcriptional regulator
VPTRLNKAELPLYLSAAALLRRRIERGEWRVGQKLPSIEQLARELSVARLTLRQALSRLERDGIVDCRHGSGTFVSRDLSPRRRYQVATDWSSLTRGIAEASQKTLPVSKPPAFPDLAADEGRPAKAYRYIKRLNLKDGVPYGFMSYHIAREVFDLAPEGFLTGPVLPLLGTLPGLSIRSARQTMIISTADVEASTLLAVPLNAPVVLARRTVIDAGGTAIFVCDITYRGDNVRFELDLLPGSPFEAAQPRHRKPSVNPQRRQAK